MNDTLNEINKIRCRLSYTFATDVYKHEPNLPTYTLWADFKLGQNKGFLLFLLVAFELLWLHNELVRPGAAWLTLLVRTRSHRWRPAQGFGGHTHSCDSLEHP